MACRHWIAVDRRLAHMSYGKERVNRMQGINLPVLSYLYNSKGHRNSVRLEVHGKVCFETSDSRNGFPPSKPEIKKRESQAVTRTHWHFGWTSAWHAILKYITARGTDALNGKWNRVLWRVNFSSVRNIEPIKPWSLLWTRSINPLRQSPYPVSASTWIYKRTRRWLQDFTAVHCRHWFYTWVLASCGREHNCRRFGSICYIYHQDRA